MRLDGDYCESTRDTLVHLCPKLSSGGYVIIDDYGEETWRYCRRGVDIAVNGKLLLSRWCVSTPSAFIDRYGHLAEVG